MSNTNSKPLAVICGAGPGFGAALCGEFVDNGYQVVGLNRSAGDLAEGVDCRLLDCTDAESVASTMEEITECYGPPSVYIHNPAHLVIKPFAETDVADFAESWRSMTMSAFIMLQDILPRMAECGNGCVIVSGATASIRGGAKFAAFASAKFALRGLTQSLAREYQPAGVHMVHVILDGIIDSARSRQLHTMSPANMMVASELAASYISLVQQPRSVWTHELDLRPQSEGF